MSDILDPEMAGELAESLARLPTGQIAFQREPCGHCSMLIVWVASAPTPHWFCSNCECRWTAEGRLWPRADFCGPYNGDTFSPEE